MPLARNGTRIALLSGYGWMILDDDSLNAQCCAFSLEERVKKPGPEIVFPRWRSLPSWADQPLSGWRRSIHHLQPRRRAVGLASRSIAEIHGGQGIVTVARGKKHIKARLESELCIVYLCLAKPFGRITTADHKAERNTATSVAIVRGPLKRND